MPDGLGEKSTTDNATNFYHPDHSHHSHNFKAEPIKSYTDEELCGLIDSVLDTLDANKDGFITYTEYKNPPEYHGDDDDTEINDTNKNVIQ